MQGDGTLGSTEFCQTSAQWGTVYVHGDEIVPSSDYTVEAIYFADANCGVNVRWASTESATATTNLWGDISPAEGDNVVDIDDLVCLLSGFAADFDPPDCTLERADLLGCEPDGLIDLDDLLGLLEAFASNPFLCGDPCDSAFMGPSGGSGPESVQATIDLVASQTEIKTGRTVVIRAFVTSEVDLRGFQVAVESTGGTSGSLNLEDIVIDDTRTDYLFYSLTDVPATDENQARAASALYTGDAPATTAKYLVSFTFRASNDAEGTFTISVRSEATMLRDENSEPVNWEPGDVAEVTVD